MAWNVKYYAEWNDTIGYRNRLEFLVEASVATPYPKEVIVKSCKITYPEIDFFGEEAMYGGGADIILISSERTVLLDDFYTSNPIGIQVRHYLQNYEEQADYLNFVGYLDTEQVEDNISGVLNYEFNVTANNGIHVLERLSLVNEDGSFLDGLYSIIDIIKFCFDKLNIAYDSIGIFISTSVTGVDLIYHETILHSLFVNSQNFYDEEEEALSCKEILNNILVSLGVKLYIHNNTIYIIELHYWGEANLIPTMFVYDTLVYAGYSSILSPFVGYPIQECIGAHTITKAPGKNKISINLNKYCYSNPNEIAISSDTLSSYVRTVDTFKNSVLLYRDVEYLENLNFSKLMDSTTITFVNRKTTSDEYFVRIVTNSTAGTKLRIYTNQFLNSCPLFIGISGQVMFEDPTRLDAQPSIGTYYGCPFYYKITLMNEEGTPIEWFELQELGTIAETYAAGKMRWLLSSVYDAPLKTNVVDYTGIRYNTWYDLNGSVNHYCSWGDTTSSAAKKVMHGIIIPLYNPKEYPFYGVKGGFLAIDIYVPTTGGENKYKNICLKDLGCTLLKKQYTIEGDFEFVEIDNADVVYQGYLDPAFESAISLDMKQGTDTSGISKAMYLLNVTGAYNTAGALNQRYEAAVKFDRGTLTEKTLEQLLLNTFISNLKKSRYIFSCTIQGYHDIFKKYTYNFVTRDTQIVKMIPIFMETDYVTSQTTFKLLEVVPDSETIES